MSIKDILNRYVYDSTNILNIIEEIDGRLENIEYNRESEMLDIKSSVLKFRDIQSGLDDIYINILRTSYTSGLDTATFPVTMIAGKSLEMETENAHENFYGYILPYNEQNINLSMEIKVQNGFKLADVNDTTKYIDATTSNYAHYGQLYGISSDSGNVSQLNRNPIIYELVFDMNKKAIDRNCYGYPFDNMGTPTFILKVNSENDMTTLSGYIDCKSIYTNLANTQLMFNNGRFMLTSKIPFRSCEFYIKGNFSRIEIG